jgi:hypothetical protein
MAAAMLAMGISSPARATNFGANDLVVYRMGDADNSAGTQPCPVYLDEVSKTGSLVGSLPMPTTVSGNQHRLVGTISGIGGMLTRSPDGKFLAVPGYDDDVNSGVDPTGFSTPGTMGIVDQSQNIDTSTILNNSDYYTGAVTNGNDIWYTNNAGGVFHVIKGQGDITNVSLEDSTNQPKSALGINIFNNQLYYATNYNKKIGAGPDRYVGIMSLGSGTPTSGPQNSAELHLDNVGGNSQTGFIMLNVPGTGAPSGLNTAYIVDPSLTQIEKFSLDGTTWTDDGGIDLGGNGWGITGEVVGGNVTLYATTDSKVLSFTDATGFGGLVSGSATTLLTAPTGETFRGIAFAPVPEPSSAMAIVAGAFLLKRRRAAK